MKREGKEAWVKCYVFETERFWVRLGWGESRCGW